MVVNKGDQGRGRVRIGRGRVRIGSGRVRIGRGRVRIVRGRVRIGRGRVPILENMGEQSLWLYCMLPLLVGTISWCTVSVYVYFSIEV